MRSADAQAHSLRHFKASMGSLDEFDQRMRRLRVSVFVVFLIFAFLGSRSNRFASWEILNGSTFSWIAGALFLLFVTLIFQHQALKARLLLWRNRMKLQEDLDALRELKPRTPLDLAGFTEESKQSHRVRDFDLLNARGFVALFPFFLTQRGRQCFLDRLNERSVSFEEIQERQKSVQFWERARVRRRSFLRLSKGLEAILNTDDLKLAVAGALSQKSEAWMRARLAFLFGLHILFLATFPLGLVGLPKMVSVSVLVSLLGSYVWFLRDLDVLQSYPRAMMMGRSLRVIVAVVGKLQFLDRGLVPARAGVLGREPLEIMSRVERAAGMLGVRQNPLLALLINILVPWDFFWSVRIETARRELVAHLETWIQAIADLETDLVLAEWSSAHGVSWPKIRAPSDRSSGGNASVLEAHGLAHPMLSASKRVANDLIFEGSARCHLITGSNMAGKSTFLRAVGMNVLIAQAGGMVTAQSLSMCPVRLESSLRPHDSLEDGFSSFYSEVADLVEILRLAQSNEGPPVLYLIDEIFRGTNNRERRLGAESVIRALANSRAYGLLTTHDLDLAALESSVPTLSNHHFRDDVRDGVMTFSYQYKKGVCPSTNAVKVMRSAGLPVIEE